MKYLYLIARMAKIKKTDHIKCWWGYKQLELSNIAGEKVQQYTQFGKLWDSVLKS